VWDTSLSALLMATILWVTLRLAKNGAGAEAKEPHEIGDATTKVASDPWWGKWCWYGLLWGLALMTNPSLGIMLPVLIGWIMVDGSRKSKGAITNKHEEIIGPALAIGIAILCCVPWTVRNYIAFHRFIPLRSNLPFELWLGNNQNFDPQSQIVPPPNPERAEIHNYIQMGETAFMQNKWRESIEFIRAHPRLEVTLFARRFVATWTGMERPVQAFIDTDSFLTRTVLTSNFLIAIGALCGVVFLLARRSPFAFPLAAFPVAFPTLYYLTHTSLRYRHPIDPILVLLTATGVSCILNRPIRRPETGR
jgi:hypothetical protein